MFEATACSESCLVIKLDPDVLPVRNSDYRQSPSLFCGWCCPSIKVIVLHKDSMDACVDRREVVDECALFFRSTGEMVVVLHGCRKERKIGINDKRRENKINSRIEFFRGYKICLHLKHSLTFTNVCIYMCEV